jgi:hypothetical protein
VKTQHVSGWLLAGLLALSPSVHAADPAAAPEPANNVVIVLDSSGSMSEKMPNSRTVKMDAAKTALKTMVRNLPSNVQIGLLVFSADNVPSDWLYPLGPRDDNKLMAAIDLPRPHNGTPLGEYLKKGTDCLLQKRAEQFGYGTYRLLVVTDGEAGDQNLVESYTPEIIARGIRVDVIGVAMKSRHTLATRVHSYRAANDEQGLQKALGEVFGEVAGSSNDSTSTEAFEAIASIPQEAAAAAIQALTVIDNTPVGQEKPRKVSRPAPTATPPAASPSPTPAPVPPSVPPPPVQPVQSVHVHSGSVNFAGIIGAMGGLACMGVVALIIIVLVLRAARGGKR